MTSVGLLWWLHRGVTVEYQRRQAKDMTAYFRSLVRTETVQKSQ